MNAASLAIGNDPLDPNRLSLNNGIQQGDFFVGPAIPPVNATPVRNIVEYLAKRDNSYDFVTLKVLHVSQRRDSDEDRQGKLLLHNEHLVLSLIQDQPGVVHHQGLFKDRNKIILVLDCLVTHPHDTNGNYKDFVNLQHYVIKKKRLEESEALELFFNVLLTVQALHKKNIVHRDIKLGNLVLNVRSRTVTLTNFALSKHLVRSNDKLTDQRGSLAYVSPDVLSGKPYDGKASDMWAMGVLLYTMLYGQFPFYDNDPQELFKKIKAADYLIPDEGYIKMGETTRLIRQLIEKDAKQRLTAAQTLDFVQNRLSRLTLGPVTECAQVVPDSVSRTRLDDCTVPDQQGDNPLSFPSDNYTLAPSNIDLNAVRLTLSPILVTEPHGMASHHTRAAGVTTLHMPIMNTSPVHMSPGSPTGISGPFVPYILTDFPPSHLQRPRPSSSSTSSQNPFVQQPSAHSLFVNTSPSNSLNVTQLSNSLPNTMPPNNVRTSPPHGNTANSFPPPSLVCHRYHGHLVNLSGDSYISSSNSSLGESSQQSAESLDMSTQSRVLFSVGGMASASPTQTVESRVVVSSQNVMDSLVTIRPSRHSFSGVTMATVSPASSSNRHSFSGERLSPQHIIPASTHSQTQRRRRNSSGSEPRFRRHSHQTISGTHHGSLDLLRRRRRSHDVRDGCNEILEGLRAVSTRRTSRTQSTPFSVPIRIQLSSPTVTTTAGH